MFSEQTRFRRLKPLPKNGTIAITAPATPVDQSRLNRGVQYFEKLGYRVEVGESCYKKIDYLAGSDALRANEFMDFIDNDSINAIVAARGGFGSMRMLKLLDFELISEKRKLFWGFSDITALQWAIYAQTGLPAISAGMIGTDFAHEEMDPDFEAAFWNLMDTGKLDIDIDHQQETVQEISGIAMPGTVSVAAKLLGSDFFPDTQDAIFLLEDVNEMRHKVEAYLQQFVICGLFDRCKAIVLGEYTPSPTEEYPEVPELQTVFDRVFRGTRVPVIQGLSYGHIRKKKALPLGVGLSLSLGPESTLKSNETIFDN